MWLRCAAAVTLSLLVVASRSARADTDFEVDRGDTDEDGRHVGDRPGLQIGVRAGFGASGGSVYQGLDVGQDSKAFVPFTADLGARLLPELYVGAYGGYAYVVPRTSSPSCPENWTCSVQSFRVGAEADLHFLPRSVLDPYLGLFGGYELLHHRTTGQTQISGNQMGTIEEDIRDRGWEVGLAAGSDVRLVRVLAVGPYVSASLGRYVTRNGTSDVRAAGETLSSTRTPAVEAAYHQLYVIGLRGTLNTL